MSELINNHIIPRTTTIAGNYNPLCILTSFLRILFVFLVYTSQKINFHGVCVKCSIIDLLAPATGKSLSCGQLIRITGISPLRGSLRAVSGSTIIILAVIAYIGSCPMVCDRDSRSSLRYPLGWRIMAYLTSGYSPGLMSQCLHIQFSMFSRGL